MAPLNKLDAEKNVIPCSGLDEWDEWRSANASACLVGIALSQADKGRVITTFIGKLPRLFETAHLNGRIIDIRGQYATWDEAVAGHERHVAEILGDDYI